MHDGQTPQANGQDGKAVSLAGDAGLLDDSLVSAVGSDGSCGVLEESRSASNEPGEEVVVSGIDAPYEHEADEAVGEAKELSFDEKVSRASKLVNHNPSYRLVFLKIIAACVDTAQSLSDLEQLVAAQPGYSKLRQPPYYPIAWLHQNYALEEMYLDAQGKLYTQADVKDLSEDEFDDLVAAYAYRVTEEGIRVAEIFSPSRRLSELLQEEADRGGVYLELLEFLREKRGFAQVETLLRGRPELKDTAKNGQTLQPSMFVDKLEAIGVIDFDGGWQITAEGRELLDSLN